jgi:transposase
MKGQVKRMTSAEVRELISRARHDGMPVHEMVKAYRVSKSTIYKLLAQEKDEGKMQIHTDRCGRPPAITENGFERMKRLIQEDITLEEIKETMHLTICLSAIHRIIRNKLGFTYKKRQYTPANATEQMS